MADKIRLGLIGASVTGTWSQRSHLPAAQASSDIELTAVCTTKADSAEAARQAYGAQLAFDDYRKMAASPEIDAVAVVVRVPSHYEPTKVALDAGKHVYCEWPLGQTTAEAEELTALAKTNGLVTAIGLQSRVNPAVMYMKEQVEAGYVGEVMAVHVSLMRDGVLTRPSNRTWQRDADLGANTLTIANGHTVDAMRFVAGDLSQLSAVVETKATQWLDTGTNEWVDVTSPDNILVSGRLANGAVASSHVAAIPYAGRHPPMSRRSPTPAAATAWKFMAAKERWSPPARILRSWARCFCRARRATTRSRQCRYRNVSRLPLRGHRRAKPSMSDRCMRHLPRQFVAATAVNRPSKPRSICIV
jgi:predicted dehydrogenase